MNLNEENESNDDKFHSNNDSIQLESTMGEDIFKEKKIIKENKLKSATDCDVPLNELNISNSFPNAQEHSYEEQKDQPTSRSDNEMIFETEQTCPTHAGFLYTSYCKCCAILVCKVCLQVTECSKHDSFEFPQLHTLQNGQLHESKKRTQLHVAQLKTAYAELESKQSTLKSRYAEMQNLVDNFHNYFLQVLQERKEEICAELEMSYDSRVMKVEEMKGAVEGSLQELKEAEALIETLLPLPFNFKFISLKMDVVQKIEEIVNLKPKCCDVDDLISRLRFHSNKQTVRSTIRNVYGQVGLAGCSLDKEEMMVKKRNDGGCLNEEPKYSYHDFGSSQNDAKSQYHKNNEVFDNKSSLDVVCRSDRNASTLSDESSNTTSQKRHHFQNCDFSSSKDFQDSNFLRQYPGCNEADLWYNHDHATGAIISDEGLRQEVRRAKMEYHCKFGEFGSEPGQFTEPSGVTVSRDGDILIADANNHRIQAFDMYGAFKRVIGQESTKIDLEAASQNEGDLVYPNRLAVNKQTGDVYVTERSPTHQVRVYDEAGAFVRRFGSHVLQHPRGITVDQMGRIIVVECKVMRVVIFNSSGSVLNRFVVEKKVNFPNAVAVNDREEIFISDNRRHGIVVFDYHGAFLRTIGGIGVTNYPIGVGINSIGELVVADNHNNFNVTIFTQDGKYLRGLESRVKHAQCFDTALVGATSIVLSSKDFRIYVYHYAESSTL